MPRHGALRSLRRVPSEGAGEGRVSPVVLGLILVTALILTVTGVLAMTTGRIALPWLRKGVKQPRVWGAGTLLIAASLTATWLVPFHGQSLLRLTPTAANTTGRERPLAAGRPS